MHERSSDLIIGELVSEVKNLRFAIEENEKRAIDWHEKFNERLLMLEKITDRFDTPVKAFFWGIAIIVASILTAIGVWVFQWFSGHWK